MPSNIERITKLIDEIFEHEQVIKERREKIVDIKEHLLEIDPNLNFEYSPNIKFIVSKERTVHIQNDKVFDFFSIATEIKDLFVAKPFKPGAIKKNGLLAPYWRETISDVVQVKKINPQFTG